MGHNSAQRSHSDQNLISTVGNPTGKKSGYTIIDNNVWHSGHAAALKGSWRVMEYLIKYQNCDHITLSIRNIANATGYHRNSIHTHLQRLEDLGYINYSITKYGTSWHRSYTILPKIYFSLNSTSEIPSAPPISQNAIVTQPEPSREAPQAPIMADDDGIKDGFTDTVASCDNTPPTPQTDAQKLCIDAQFLGILKTKDLKTKDNIISSSSHTPPTAKGNPKKSSTSTKYFIPASATKNISKESRDILNLSDKELINKLPELVSDHQAADNLDADIWAIFQNREHPLNQAVTHKLLALSEMLEKASSQEIDKILPVLKERGIEKLTYARGVFRQAFR